MSKGAKILVYILLAAIGALIVYIIVTGKQQKGGTPPAQKPKTPDNSNTNTDNTDAGNAGIDTTQQGQQVNTATIPLDTNVYAAENILNVYTSCSVSQSNIYQTFNKGDLIGKFIAKESNCTRVAIPTYYTAYFIGSWQTGTADGYIPFNAKIYFK